MPIHSPAICCLLSLLFALPVSLIRFISWMMNECPCPLHHHSHRLESSQKDWELVLSPFIWISWVSFLCSLLRLVCLRVRPLQWFLLAYSLPFAKQVYRCTFMIVRPCLWSARWTLFLLILDSASIERSHSNTSWGLSVDHWKVNFEFQVNLCAEEGCKELFIQAPSIEFAGSQWS